MIADCEAADKRIGRDWKQSQKKSWKSEDFCRRAWGIRINIRLSIDNMRLPIDNMRLSIDNMRLSIDNMRSSKKTKCVDFRSPLHLLNSGHCSTLALVRCQEKNNRLIKLYTSEQSDFWWLLKNLYKPTRFNRRLGKMT